MHIAIGMAGMVTFLLAYFLVSSKKIEPSGIKFNMMNVVAALAVTYSLIPAWDTTWPTITLEIFWIAIGLVAIYKHVRSRKV